MTKTPRNNKPWNKKDTERLRSAARRQVPVRDVAKALGRSPAATQQKAMRLGLSFR
jgi:hypothetical protein